MQIEMTGLSSKGKRILAEQSGHYIHLKEPELVIKAIKEVISELRKIERIIQEHQPELLERWQKEYGRTSR